jgi:CrcB protein
MHMLLAVAAGGAIGAVGRFLLSGWLERLIGLAFPWGTLGVNMIGAFLLGCLAEIMALVWSPAPELRALLTVGVLGAFTTFSAFSLELALMLQRGEWLTAAAHGAGSVVLCVLALFAGLMLFRALLA